MKYLVISLFLLLAGSAFAENSDQNKQIVIKYNLSLNFDKDSQKIKVIFFNESPVDLQIKWDFSPFSLYSGGITLSAFEDSDDLLPVKILHPIGHSSELISMPANKPLGGEIDLIRFPMDYCRILDKSSILIFWSYSYYSDKYVLYPTRGVFRIKKSDVKCENNR